MTTTCRTLIDEARARNSANDAALVQDPECIRELDLRLKEIYQLVARKSPSYFGASISVIGDGTRWARPAGALSVFRVEADGAAGSGADRKIQTIGTEVHLVPLDDREAELAPRVYSLGRAYYSVGIAATDPSASINGDKLKFFRSRQHADLDPTLAANHATNTLETDWPEQHNQILVVHLAKFFSLKDVARSDSEYRALEAEEERFLVLFEQHLENENIAMKARFGQMAQPLKPTVRGSDVR